RVGVCAAAPPRGRPAGAAPGVAGRRPAPPPPATEFCGGWGGGAPAPRRYAASALGEIGPDAARALPLLLEATEDPDPISRAIAVAAVRKIDPQALSRE